jgi:hypothetical protein
MSKNKNSNRLYKILLAVMAVVMIISMIAAAIRF